jgi:hypothetical protein
VGSCAVRTAGAFDVYLRIALWDGDDESPLAAVRAALETLALCTTTADRGYAAIWEGWAATRPRLRRRGYASLIWERLPFTGAVGVLADAPALAWYGSVEGAKQDPDLVWPEDQPRCLACEVDEEIEFNVGCAREAATALVEALPGIVRVVHYGERAPRYRDEV